MSELEVNRCDYYVRKDNCFAEEKNCQSTYCSENKNCYYKQLRKLKQKNEKLKNRLKPYTKPDIVKALTFYITGEFDIVEQRLTKAEQKLKKIKEICKHCKMYSFLEKDEEILLQDILEIIESEE